jgi:hypothetical protein
VFFWQKSMERRGQTRVLATVVMCGVGWVVVTAEAAAVAGLSTRQGGLALQPLH